MKHVVRVVTKWALLLHIWVSMAGFVLVLLFSVTGVTLNHGDFGLSEPRQASTEVTVPAALLERPDQQALVGYLRDTLIVTAPVLDYRDDGAEIDVTFAAPGIRTLVYLDRRTGTARVETESRGVLGVLGDLHKGLDSGPIWSWVIDVTAVMLTVIYLLWVPR